MFCRKCGKELKEGAKFCASCGARVEAVGAPNPESRPTPPPAPVQQDMAPEPQPEPRPRPQPAPAQQPPVQPPKKKTPIGLIIGLIVLLAAIVAVAVVVFVVKPPFLEGLFGNSGQDSQVEEDKDKDSDKGKTKDKDKDKDKDKNKDEEDTRDKDAPDIDEEGLLLIKLEEVKKERGDLTGVSGEKRIDIKGYNPCLKKANGVMGYVIGDVSGDDVLDMIVVYSLDNYMNVYGDAYTIDDGEVVCKSADIFLIEGQEYFEDFLGVVYLRELDGEWYLFADHESQGFHGHDFYAMGTRVYSCKDNKFALETNRDVVGTGPLEEDVDAYINLGERFGIRNATEPLILLNSDVTGVAGYYAEFNDALGDGWDNHFYNHITNGEDKELVYGQMNIASLTDSEGKKDSRRLNDLLSGYEDAVSTSFAASSGAAVDVTEIEGDFVFPDSSRRLLTEAEVAAIAHDKNLLAIARNEIYARYGYQFTTNQAMIDYFAQKSWYRPTTTDQQGVYNSFSDIEKKNIDLIRKYEEN